MHGLLTCDAAAERLSISTRHLERMRVAGTGPAYVRIGARRVAYRPDDIAEWLAARTFPHRAAELAQRAA
jgi:predicted DNA-binding transcriptional regulator AlpA